MKKLLIACLFPIHVCATEYDVVIVEKSTYTERVTASSEAEAEALIADQLRSDKAFFGEIDITVNATPVVQAVP